MIDRGYTSDQAIDMMYSKYGESLSVNAILKALEADKGCCLMSPAKPGGLKRRLPLDKHSTNDCDEERFVQKKKKEDQRARKASAALLGSWLSSSSSSSST